MDNNIGVEGRRSEIQWLNVAFCAMVIGIHCTSHPVTHLDPMSWQFALVYLLQQLSFVSVYGFFLLAGVKLTLPRAQRIGAADYYLGRVRTILLPYCLACAVYYFYYCFVRHFYVFSPKDFLSLTVSGLMASPFYFIVTLAQFIVLMPLLRYVAEQVSPVFSLPLALGITWASGLHFADLVHIFLPESAFRFGDRMCTTYLFYYLAGCYIGLRYEDFLAALRRNRRFVCGAFALTAAADLYLSYRARVMGLVSPLVGWAHFLYLPCAVAFCYLVAAGIHRPLPRPLARVDRASFLIFLYHTLLILIADKAFEDAGIVSVGVQYALRLGIVYLGAPLVCVAWQQGYGALRALISKPNHSGGMK